MRDDDGRMVRLHQVMLSKMADGFTTLNSNNFVVYGQKHKVWVLVYLVRTSGDQN